MQKALLPGQDAAFNQEHPRAPAGTAGGLYRPGQFTPKTQAERQQEEAEDFSDAEEPEAGDASAQTVSLSPDTKVAMASDHARQRRVAEAVEAPATPVEESQPQGQRAAIRQVVQKSLAPVAEEPALIVLFTARGDATKFALACDAVQGGESHTRVEAEANGRYRVEPSGLGIGAIARLQDLLAAGTPLGQITRAAVVGLPERGEAYELLQAAAAKISPAALPEVQAMAKAGAALTGDGGLGALEALHYGSIRGLIAAMTGDDPLIAARAAEVAAWLVKGKA